MTFNNEMNNQGGIFSGQPQPQPQPQFQPQSQYVAPLPGEQPVKNNRALIIGLSSLALVIVLVVGGVLLFTRNDDAGSDEAQIRKVASDFIAASHTLNFSAMKKLSCAADKDDIESDGKEMLKDAGETQLKKFFAKFTLEFSGPITVKGNAASALMKMTFPEIGSPGEMKTGDFSKVKTQEEMQYFRKENGSWKTCDAAEKDISGSVKSS